MHLAVCVFLRGLEKMQLFFLLSAVLRLKKTDEQVITYNSRKNAKVNMPSITTSGWAKLVPPQDSTPDTFGQLMCVFLSYTF